MKIDQLFDEYNAWAKDYYVKPRSRRRTRMSNNVRAMLGNVREVRIP